MNYLRHLNSYFILASSQFLLTSTEFFQKKLLLAIFLNSFLGHNSDYVPLFQMRYFRSQINELDWLFKFLSRKTMSYFVRLLICAMVTP